MVENNYKETMQSISGKLAEDIISKPRQRTDPFLVNLWTIILQVLERVSIFDMIRQYMHLKKLGAIIALLITGY